MTRADLGRDELEKTDSSKAKPKPPGSPYAGAGRHRLIAKIRHAIAKRTAKIAQRAGQGTDKDTKPAPGDPGRIDPEMAQLLLRLYGVLAAQNNPAPAPEEDELGASPVDFLQDIHGYLDGSAQSVHGHSDGTAHNAPDPEDLIRHIDGVRGGPWRKPRSMENTLARLNRLVADTDEVSPDRQKTLRAFNRIVNRPHGRTKREARDKDRIVGPGVLGSGDTHEPVTLLGKVRRFRHRLRYSPDYLLHRFVWWIASRLIALGLMIFAAFIAFVAFMIYLDPPKPPPNQEAPREEVRP